MSDPFHNALPLHHKTPLLGRKNELTALLDQLSDIEQLKDQNRPTLHYLVSDKSFSPRPHTSFLLGDIGIGKTRLAEEVAGEALRRGWAVAWGRVYAQESSIPCRLWIEVLHTILAPILATRTKSLEGVHTVQLSLPFTHLQQVFHPLTVLLPELERFFPTPFHFQPDMQHMQLFLAVRQVLAISCERTPTLIVLDDLHWSDEASCSLLLYLARHMQGYPLLMLATCRERDLPRDHPLLSILTDLQREHKATTVRLKPLSDEEVEALITSIAPLPISTIQSVVAYADGNPYFAEELACDAKEENGRDTSRRQELSSAFDGFAEQPQAKSSSVFASAAPISLRFPSGVAAVFSLQLGRLSTPCRKFLEKIACLGVSTDMDEILALEALLNRHYSIDRVREGLHVLLDEAEEAHLLFSEHKDERLLVHFWHPLLRVYVYESLSEARRAFYRQFVAQIHA